MGIKHGVSQARSSAGRVARKDGLSFEDETDGTWAELHREGLGVMRKTHMQAGMIKGSWRPIGKGPFDRFGLIWLKNSLFPVYYEIKTHTVEQKSMPKKFTLGEGDEHQLQALRDFYNVGGYLCKCFVLVDWRCEFPSGERVAEMRLHPITAVIGRTLYREHSIHAPNRNWYGACMSPAYQLLVEAGGFMYTDDDDIPL